MKMKYFIFVLMAGMLFFSSCGSKKKPQPQPKQVAKDTVVKKQVVVPAPEPEPEPEKVDEGVRLSDKYFLVINSYTVKEFAESANKEYQKQGFNSAIFMHDGDGYYRLALKSFNDFDKAKAEMANMRKDPQYKDIWVLKK